MSALGPHTGYILAAYVGVALAVALLVAITWYGWTVRKRRLDLLESVTGRRRKPTK